MIHRPMRAALLMVAALATAAGAQQQSAPMVVSSDPELARIAESLLPGIAERSGLELLAPVRLERRSRAQLASYLQVKLDEELPVEEARAVVDAYALLGLVPPDLDLRSVLLGLYGEQIAGFYEPDSTALFVMDDQRSADLEPLLMHELVHAIQDQHTDLSALVGPEVESDRATAAQAAVEGHATLVMMEYMAEQMMGVRLDLAAMPDFGPQLRAALDMTRSQFPELDQAPRIIQESLLFPYLEGASFVQALWSRGGRVAPLGDFLPQSSEQVMEHDLTDLPVELELVVSGARTVDDDVLGRLSLGVLLTEHLGAAGEGLDAGWAGDHYVLTERPDGGRGLVWYVVWDDATSRDRFASAMRGALDRFGGPATLERADVAGRPATVIRVGALDGVAAQARLVDAP